MTPDFTMTVKANPDLHTQAAVMTYLEVLAADHPELADYRYALIDIVNTQHDDQIEIYNIPDMEGDFVSSANGTRLLWMPEIGRAALNAYQGGDWAWSDASDPEDALRRYAEDDLAA
jgi:hypothetical protein